MIHLSESNSYSDRFNMLFSNASGQIKLLLCKSNVRVFFTFCFIVFDFVFTITTISEKLPSLKFLMFDLLI